jgi:acyl-CoA synthetase (AMP-forming)/AMP-acid ligase II
MVRHHDVSTMGEALSYQAACRPDQRVFVFLERGEHEVQSFTFTELDQRAHSIARLLLENGLDGRRVVLNYPSCLEFVAALFGCFYAGTVAIPAPAGSHGNSLVRTSSILADSEAAAVLTQRSLIERGLAGFAGPESGNVALIATDEIPACETTAPQRADPAAPAMLQYTSGSTGDPRGVILTHSNLIHNQRALAEAIDSHPEDIGVSWLPLYHDMGLMGGVLHPVYGGGFCALMSPLAFVQKPVRWLRAIGRYRATISVGPCFAYNLCVRQHVPGEDAALDVSSWRVALCGGETIRPRVLERFADTFRAAGFQPKALMAGYGLAEATLLVTSPAAGRGITSVPSPAGAAEDYSGGGPDPWRRQLACCGSTRGPHRIAIVDPASCQRVFDGEVGEIWIQGPSVAAGYWNRAEETKATFEAELAGEAGSGRWLRSGDLGFLSPHGLVVTGRRKEIIVIRGANPSLSAGGAAAFSIELEEGEGVVLAFEIERGALESLNLDFLVSQVVAVVNRRFGLTLYDVVLRPGTLPRTTSGKIQRYLCRHLYLTGRDAAFRYTDHPALARCRIPAPESVA